MPFAKTLGIRLIAAGPEGVEAEMAVRADLCTAGGVAHGGAIMALADSLGGLAAMLALPEGAKGTTTVESKTNLLGPGKAGETLLARSAPVKTGRRLSVWKTEIAVKGGGAVALTIQTQLVL